MFSPSTPISPQPWVVSLEDVGRDDVATVGGKGANLGEMLRLGLPVPPGFCVTTAAFSAFVGEVPGFDDLRAQLDQLDSTDLAGVSQLAGRLRQLLCQAPIPQAIREAIAVAVTAVDLEGAYAVRSSATLEDLPDASFAGQQDTYLNVRGIAEICTHVRACWASLFTDRAVIYRRQQGYDSKAARLSVVIQRMIPAEISGIAFTADPVTQHRHVCAIDASYGLGEALVSGLVNADNYRVDRWTGEVLQTRVGDKALAIRPLPGGGTRTEDVAPVDRERLALNEPQIAELVALIDRVEAHYGCPQDLEWCLEKGVFYLVQSRAITSLFPLPKSLLRRRGEPLRVFVSFGHIQVNTAPFPRLSHAIFRRVLPIGKPTIGAGFDEQSTVVTSIAGRVFIDATPALSRFPTSVVIPKVIGNMDAVIAGRLRTVCSRPSFRRGPRKQRARVRALTSFALPVLLRAQLFLWWYKPTQALERFERLKNGVASVMTRARAEHPPGVERLRAATTAVAKLCRHDLLQAHPSVPAAGLMAWKLLEWFMAGKVEPGVIEALTRGLDGNVTTEMDLELGDLADLARGTPIAKVLRAAPPKLAIEQIRALSGAEAFVAAWDHFIATYGARCPGEIDFSVPRWREDPSSLVTSLAGMLHGSEPGHHRRRESEAREQAKVAGEHLERAASTGWMGGLRRRLVRRLIICIRTYLGLREHGKFYMVQAFDELRKISLECGQVGVERGVFEAAEDVFSFDFDELEQALDESSEIAAGHWRETAVARRNELRRNAELRVPAVLTNDGEIPPMPVAKDLPPGVFAGQGVSSGVVEGVARVITDPTTEVLLAGEILVAPFTDPGWTPLFVHAAGLVMEVGGLMTHGSVVAREYGIPAVVSVESALSRIKTGDIIRVDGENGWVKIVKPLASTSVAGAA